MDNFLRSRTEIDATKTLQSVLESIVHRILSRDEQEHLELAVHEIIAAAAEKGRGQIS